MNKIINISARLRCEPKKAFEMFTVNELLESWLTVRADVEPKVGGKYELFGIKKTKRTIAPLVARLQPSKNANFYRLNGKVLGNSSTS